MNKSIVAIVALLAIGAAVGALIVGLIWAIST
jgi:hypothetical protein